jgi:hypothetical protein
MNARILLVNPPIYDFAAYDFWLKPYGLLSIAGYLRNKVQFTLFDYLDRLHPFMQNKEEVKQSDRWSRGRFYYQQIPKPTPLQSIPRHFNRFGLPREIFKQFLQENGPWDYVLVQTVMTYWYPGIEEVIADIRSIVPDAKIVLGGNYVTLCKSHAETLGADLLVSGTNLEPLWQYMQIEPDLDQPALWESYERLKTGALKISDGCPFSCTYCSVPKVYDKFKPRPLERALAEIELLAKLGVTNAAFYDDALLFKAEKVLMPFLEEILNRNIKINLHSPNALNARLMTKELAQLMVLAGFKTFYLGFESASEQWQNQTGAKVFSAELAEAVKYLTDAGAEASCITAYQILGHPDSDMQQLEQSMRFVNSLGIRGMLADFSPIPGTADGDRCSQWVDMNEPLTHNKTAHNKTAFAITRLGFDETNQLKNLQRQLNRKLSPSQ